MGAADTVRSGGGSNGQELVGAANAEELANTVRGIGGSRSLELERGAVGDANANTSSGRGGSDSLVLKGSARSTSDANAVRRGGGLSKLVLVKTALGDEAAHAVSDGSGGGELVLADTANGQRSADTSAGGSGGGDFVLAGSADNLRSADTVRGVGGGSSLVLEEGERAASKAHDEHGGTGVVQEVALRAIIRVGTTARLLAKGLSDQKSKGVAGGPAVATNDLVEEGSNVGSSLGVGVGPEFGGPGNRRQSLTRGQVVHNAAVNTRVEESRRVVNVLGSDGEGGWVVNRHVGGGKEDEVGRSKEGSAGEREVLKAETGEGGGRPGVGVSDGESAGTNKGVAGHIGGRSVAAKGAEARAPGSARGAGLVAASSSRAESSRGNSGANTSRDRAAELDSIVGAIVDGEQNGGRVETARGNSDAALDDSAGTISEGSQRSSLILVGAADTSVDANSVAGRSGGSNLVLVGSARDVRLADTVSAPCGGSNLELVRTAGSESAADAIRGEGREHSLVLVVEARAEGSAHAVRGEGGSNGLVLARAAHGQAGADSVGELRALRHAELVRGTCSAGNNVEHVAQPGVGDGAGGGRACGGHQRSLSLQENSDDAYAIEGDIPPWRS